VGQMLRLGRIDGELCPDCDMANFSMGTSASRFTNDSALL
jgi:hypothetical protein